MKVFMDLKAKKLELVRLILKTEKSAVLEKVEALLKKEVDSDWWDEIGEDEKNAIEEALAEADREELISHEKVMKEIRAKYGLSQ
jgi:thiamine pyrophosphate-dependent acetolactate synthase large subunit-like protein